MSQPKAHLFLVPPGASISAASLDLDDLFRDHSGHVAGLATRLLGHEGEVDALVSDVFVRAVRELNRVPEPNTLRHWFTVITVKGVLRVLWRRRLLRAVGLSSFKAHELSADEGLDAYGRALVTNLYRALDELSPALRVTWLLRFGEALDVSQIAAVSGWPRALVLRRLERAQRQLAKELGDE